MIWRTILVEGFPTTGNVLNKNFLMINKLCQKRKIQIEMNVLEFNTEQRMSDMERTFHAFKVKNSFT